MSGCLIHIAWLAPLGSNLNECGENITQLKRSRLRKQISWCNRLANKDKGTFYTNLITANSEDPKKLWQSLRKVLHCTSETVLRAQLRQKPFFTNKISKIRDTFSTSGSLNDAPDSVPPAFNTFKHVTVTGKRGSNYRLSLSCNRKSKKLNLTNLFNSQQ